MKKLGVAVYGINGHQIHRQLEGHEHAQLVATAAFDADKLTPAQREDPAIRHYSSLFELLKDTRVELVSLCSPRRADQAADAITCLKAGRHVYAEKPCA